MKKIISILVSISLVFCCGIGSDATTTEDSNSIVLSENDVLGIKENYDLTAMEEKNKYLNDVFSTLGADSKFVGMMNNDLINKFVNAEEFGYSKIMNSDSSENTTWSYGNNTRHYDKMDLAIIWAKSGNEYTILGGCEWLDIPILQIDDIVSIDLGDGSVVDGSQILSVQYEKDGELHEDAYDSDDENYQGTGTACVFEYNVPNFPDTINVLIGYSIINSSDENTISLQYFHKFFPFPASISVSHIVGISVSPESIFTEYNLQCGTA